jgi:murein DD-endopeptidase MepM/ murein hydrolase activator NlpD
MQSWSDLNIFRRRLAPRESRRSSGGGVDLPAGACLMAYPVADARIVAANYRQGLLLSFLEFNSKFT